MLAVPVHNHNIMIMRIPDNEYALSSETVCFISTNARLALFCD